MDNPQPRPDVMERLLLAIEEAAREGDMQRVEAIERAIAAATDGQRVREAADLQRQASSAAQDLHHRALAHRTRMETLRYIVAILLIFVLFAVILTGVVEGLAGDSVAQFAAPVSGLAGIAIGWLFGGRDQGRDSLEAPPAPSSLANEPPSAQPGIYIGGSNFGGRVCIEPAGEP